MRFRANTKLLDEQIAFNKLNFVSKSLPDGKLLPGSSLLDDLNNHNSFNDLL